MSSSVEEIVPSLIETITRISSRQCVSITPRSMTSRPGSPNSASWLHGVRCLDTMVLPQLADAVEDETETGTSPAGLPDAPYRAAADAVNNLAAALPRLPAPVGSPSAGSQGTSDTVFLRAVPAWETDALWQVHVALRCARDGEPDAAALGDRLREVGEDCPPSPDRRRHRRPAQPRTRRATARHLRRPHARHRPRPQHTAGHPHPDAYEQIHAAWTTAGIH
ncbi:hypothetical protein [Streptomyces sp. NPDC059802]|uniref:hypothetical protein n=1 Tax=Streptomyces sp. NPDC059802 TaxID=3346952 RepID=UPI003650D288